MYKGVLTVSQTYPNQQRVEDLIRSLHDLPPDGPARHDELPRGISIQRPTPQLDKIQRVLAKPTDVLLSEQSLAGWAIHLSAQNDVPVLIDGTGLELAGVDEMEPLTIELKNITLRSALRIAVRTLDLTYLVKDEAILITTLEEAEMWPATRIYPIAGIVDVADSADRHVKPDYDLLLDLITRTLRPESWVEAGGTGTIAVFPNRNCLVVSQTDEVHEDVARFLESLYAAHRDKKVGSRTSQLPDQTAVITVVYQLLEAPPQLAAAPKRPSDLAFGARASGSPASSLPSLTAEDLRGLVLETVATETWNQGLYRIKAVPGRLVVAHERRVHQEIVTLFRKLGGDVPNNPLSRYPHLERGTAVYFGAGQDVPNEGGCVGGDGGLGGGLGGGGEDGGGKSGGDGFLDLTEQHLPRRPA